jgi:hydrogenase-1 operon protein HyaF
MKTLSIPVRVVGPGSQPVDDEELQYLDMPRGMNTFRMPEVPVAADGDALAAAHDLLTRFSRMLETWDPTRGRGGARLAVTGLSAAAVKIVNQMLGEGEVSVQVSGARGARIQESVFTGIWRVCELDGDGALARDWIEAGALPAIAVEAAHAAAGKSPTPVALPQGAMNSPALLNEIADRMRRREAGLPAHVINLTLFPLTPEDHQVLEQAFPVGPVAMISRGFGNCRITSTLARDVWRVQYFNSMNTLILNTIEVVDLPEVAIAAADDLVDSRERLADLVAWMEESCAA